MAIVTGTPIKFTNISLVLGADTFDDMISVAELVPTASVSTFKAINGKNRPIVGKSTWMLNLTLADDLTTTTSLHKKLITAEGTKVTAKLYPNGTTVGQPLATIDVWLVAAGIGGSGDADATKSVSLPCENTPVLS